MQSLVARYIPGVSDTQTYKAIPQMLEDYFWGGMIMLGTREPTDPQTTYYKANPSNWASVWRVAVATLSEPYSESGQITEESVWRQLCMLVISRVFCVLTGRCPYITAIKSLVRFLTPELPLPPRLASASSAFKQSSDMGHIIGGSFSQCVNFIQVMKQETTPRGDEVWSCTE